MLGDWVALKIFWLLIVWQLCRNEHVYFRSALCLKLKCLYINGNAQTYPNILIDFSIKTKRQYLSEWGGITAPILYSTFVLHCVSVCVFVCLSFFHAWTKGCFKLWKLRFWLHGSKRQAWSLSRKGLIPSHHLSSCLCWWYKETLAEVEEKYRKAMVSNAQLDNEKNNLMYQVDTLKDSLMELEELLSESQRGYEDKIKVSMRLSSCSKNFVEWLTSCILCPHRNWRERNTPTVCFSFSSLKSKRRSNKAKSS